MKKPPRPKPLFEFGFDIGKWRVYPCPDLQVAVRDHVSEPDDANFKVQDEVYDLPKDWKSLTWYHAVQSPCIDGDDLFIALSPDNQVGYSIFDCSCGRYHVPTQHRSIEAFAQWVTTEEDLHEYIVE